MVEPVIYALPCASTAIADTRSSAEPPRYVQYTSALPAGLSLATKTSLPPPFELCAGLVTGKLVESVNPATYADPGGIHGQSGRSLGTRSPQQSAV